MALPRPAQISAEPGINASALQWANLLVDELQKSLSNQRSFTVVTRPDPASVRPGTIIFVSDGGAGAVFQGSTGSAWVNLG